MRLAQLLIVLFSSKMDSLPKLSSTERNISLQSKLTALTEISEEDFLLKIRSSIDAETPLDFEGCQVTLKTRAIRLRGRDHLEIHGGLIVGAIHSLFQIDGDKKNHPRRLTLRRTRLRHTKVHEDPREIGAAIFAMGSSVIVLEECDISSLGGFAVWAKHRCSVTIENCQIHDVARTAIACFNSVEVHVKNTALRDVGIHGICGRGISMMRLQNVIMDKCQIRAVMVYQGARMELDDCIISNTLDCSTPTIHAQGPSREDLAQATNATAVTADASTVGEGNNGTPKKTLGPDDYKLMIPCLSMKHCQVFNSAGPPLLIEGTVEQYLEDNGNMS